MAAERKTELSISELCTKITENLVYIDDHSHVTTENVVDMQQVLSFLESMEFYALQARLLVMTLK